MLLYVGYSRGVFILQRKLAIKFPHVGSRLTCFLFLSKLENGVLLPFYCQNTVIALILIISKRLKKKNFKPLRVCLYVSIVFCNNAMICSCFLLSTKIKIALWMQTGKLIIHFQVLKLIFLKHCFVIFLCLINFCNSIP